MLLTLNAGSSTIKIALFEVAPSRACRVAKGLIDFRRNSPNFHVTGGRYDFRRQSQDETFRYSRCHGGNLD